MSKIPTIEINTDRPCIQCGKPGAIKREDGSDGFCLECVANNIKVRNMDINDKMLKQAGVEISNLLDKHIKQINTAYLDTESELTISLGLKFGPGKLVGEIKMTTSINFIEARVKESNTITFDDKQKQLFE